MLNSELPALPAECRNIIQSVRVDASGTISYLSEVESANVEIVASYLAVYTRDCLSSLSGSAVTATPALCARAQSTMNDAEPGATVACAVAGADCSCNITQKLATGTQTDGYSVKGGTVVYSSGGTPMSFCIEGDLLQARITEKSIGFGILMTAHRI